MISQKLKFATLQRPKADVMASGLTTSIVDVRYHDEVCIIVMLGDRTSTTGKETYNLEVVNTFNAIPSAAQKATIPTFRYRQGVEGTDVLGAVTRTTSTTGYVNTAGDENNIIVFELTGAEIRAAADANSLSNPVGVRLTAAETVADAVPGAVLVVLDKPRYRSATDPAVIGVTAGL
jgi:hypothetical protein